MENIADIKEKAKYCLNCKLKPCSKGCPMNTNIPEFIEKIKEENFEEEVLKSEKPVLVDFFATWCGPCQMLAPVLEEIAEEYKDKIKVGKINIDNERNLAIKYQVVSIPTLMVFKNGEIVKTAVGFHTKSELEGMLNI